MIFNLVLYGTLLCLSFYLQQARHASVLATGLLLLPGSVVTGAGSLASGRLTARLRPRPRFGREVTALTRIQGVCTVRVIEADTEAPKPFLVTEYADGPSLSEYVDARGPLDPRRPGPPRRNCWPS